MKLEGVKVLDLSLFLPGPMLTLMMADHGADVIKVEPVGEGELEADVAREGLLHGLRDFPHEHLGRDRGALAVEAEPVLDDEAGAAVEVMRRPADPLEGLAHPRDRAHLLDVARRAARDAWLG